MYIADLNGSGIGVHKQGHRHSRLRAALEAPNIPLHYKKLTVPSRSFAKHSLMCPLRALPQHTPQHPPTFLTLSTIPPLRQTPHPRAPCAKSPLTRPQPLNTFTLLRIRGISTRPHSLGSLHSRSYRLRSPPSDPNPILSLSPSPPSPRVAPEYPPDASLLAAAYMAALS
jgi:hypothetical protein